MSDMRADMFAVMSALMWATGWAARRAMLESRGCGVEGRTAGAPGMEERAVAAQPQIFGDLLRRLRREAGLTQEALAERAGVSARAIAALERGVNQAPRRDTLQLLAEALGLPAGERAALAAAARRPGPAAVATEGRPPERAADAALEGSPPAVAAVADLPSGTLSFLLTDVEGSTAYWDRHPTAMRAALARHDALFDGYLGRHGGRQVKERGEGDSIFAVFSSPSAALAAACELQRALLAEPWPAEAPLRVRMGLHTGEAELRGIGYYGASVNRTARIRSLGHGGQILLSRSTYDLVRDALPEGVTLQALGSHGLKGLERPEEVYQLLHPALPAAFPPLEAALAPRTNLPAQLTSFIGREREQVEVLGLLAGARLVTLTGAGGAGKTRLALAVAGGGLSEYPDGIWLVELAPLTDPALVAQATAQALGLLEEAGRPLLGTLLAHLRTKHLLLVLDNCEHLVAACAELATALLLGCPHLRILATSREGLEVAGERLYRVPSLVAPPLDRLPAPEQLVEYAAVALFVARAQERRPGFALSAQNARAVAQVCARLDGMPLAIELAAARVDSLGVEGIAARLDDRFRLLTGGPRTALPRQQTLRAALDWSYDLLTVQERLVLDRLAVVAGGCTLAAAEAVCAGEGIEDWEVPDLLRSLVHESLVQAEEHGKGEVRYSLLETVRQYGWERLSASEQEATRARDRHLAYFLALAEGVDPFKGELGVVAWLERLGAEHDNLRAALGWARERRAFEDGLRLAGALAHFWWRQGHSSEGRAWLGIWLAYEQGPPALRAKALLGAAHLAWHEGDYKQAAVLHREGLALRRALGDGRGIAWSLNGLGNVAASQSDFRRAAALFEESLALFRDQSDVRGTATALANLGLVAYSRGDFSRADAFEEECLAIARVLGDPGVTASALTTLGVVACERGDQDRAVALLEESLRLMHGLGDKSIIASVLHALGWATFQRGEHSRAAALFAESLQISRAIGARRTVAGALERVAQAAAARAQSRLAAQLGGAAEAVREALGSTLPPVSRADHDRAVRTIRAALGDEAFAATWAEGRALPLEEAITLALGGYSSAGAPRAGAGA